MKKRLSLFLVLTLLFSCMPYFEVHAAKALNPNGTTEIEAKANDGDYDASSGKAGIPVESGNLSFNQDDYVIFKVSVSKKAEYSVDFLTGCPPGSAPVFDIYIDGAYKTTVNISSGADYTDYHQNSTVGKVELSSGEHEVKILNSSAYGVYFRGIIFEPTEVPPRLITKGAYRETVLPAVIEAEDFDLGQDGATSIDGVNNGRQYRKEDKIDIYSNGADGYYIELAAGESVKYTFNVQHEGAYTMWLGASTSGTASIYFDNAPYALDISGSGAATEAKAAVIYFEKGEHSIRVASETGKFTLDKLRFSNGGENALTVESFYTEQNKEDENLSASGKHSVFHEFYVSENGSDDGDGSENAPFLTLTAAQKAVREINSGMTGDIIVNIKEGSYFLPETLNFGTEDGGKNGYNVIYKGLNENNPPIVHGGKRVTNWTEYKNGIYKAPLSGVEHLRNFYVDGQPMTRARSKYMYPIKEMYSTSATRNEGFKVDGSNFPQIAKPEVLETVWPVTWFTQRLQVEDITRTDSDVIIHMQQPSFAMLTGADTVETVYGKACFLENALELLDEPGEFYYDKDEETIYFYPYKEQNLNTAEAYAPVTEYLMNISGTDKTNKLENLTFENIDFRYGAWNDTSKEGFKGTQATSLFKVVDGVKVNYTMPAQIMINRAKNINIKDCRFSCMTATALEMNDAVSDSKVSGCAFWNLGGAGIIVDTFLHDPAYNKDSAMLSKMEQCKNITVENNLFRRVALEYYGCVAIHAYYPKNFNVYHNDIYDTPYTGMSVGWGWGTEKLTDCCFDISYNRIVGSDKYMADGGNIYTLGETTGSTISYNYLASNADSRGGVYNDSGSKNIEIFKNVIEDVSRWWVQGMYNTGYLTAHDNWSERIDIYHVAATGNTTPQELLAKGHTLVPNANWTGEAAEIVENAGLEKEYRHLFDLVEFPEWLADPINALPKTDYNSARLNWIQAEDFMKGGEGVGYHKITPIYSSSYRPMEGVDMYKDYTSTAMGYVIGTDFHGEWWAYEAEVEEDGEYAIDVRAAQAGWGSGVDVYVDNVKVSEGVLLTDDTNYWKHNLTRVAVVNMKKGNHIVKIEINGGSFFFDAVGVTPANIPLHAEEGTIDEGKIVSREEFTEQKINPYKKTQTSFKDMENHWAKKEVIHLAEAGIIAGVGDDAFAPEESLTKGQAARLILRALKLVYNEETEASYLEIAEENGYLKADEANDEISRQELAKMLTNAIVYKKGECLVDVASGNFADNNEIGSEYSVSVLAAASAGLMVGDEENMFRPKKTLTRAEAATVINRLIYT